MHTFWTTLYLKYLYMSRTQRHIKSQSNITYEESYANLQQPTNATFVSKETMEINQETESIRQTSENVSIESKLAENQETKRQAKTESAFEDMEGKPVGLSTPYVQ